MAKKKRGRSYGRKKPYRQKSYIGILPTGKIRVSLDGYGFVETAEGNFFIPASRLNGAMDGDMVRVRPSSNRRPDTRSKSGQPYKFKSTPKATVDCVLERAHERIVGLYLLLEGIGYVVPQDRRLDYLIRAAVPSGLNPKDGDVVLLAFSTYPSKHEEPSGMVERILGNQDDPDILDEIIAARHGIKTDFSQNALEDARQCTLDIDKALQESDRRDIRDRLVITIDPANARDFDDALSVDYPPEAKGDIRLGVHIADVSNYVLCDTHLDLEARAKSTSTYFPKKVFPMLPEELSCGLCSLNPNEERLAFSVDMVIDSNGDVVLVEIYPSVIKSRARLDYSSIQSMFDKKIDYPEDEVGRLLKDLHKLTSKLRNKRMSRGALDFDSSELKVLFDETGEPVDVVTRSKTDATDLVEEAMILANEVVASYMLKHNNPCVYRIHDEPAMDSIEEIRPVLKGMGYNFKKAKSMREMFQNVLDDSKGTSESQIVSSIMLRAMKQAVYSDEFTTHFGLASNGYCHFTSPIRRYPDLMTHRLLRKALFNEAISAGKISKNAPKPAAIKNLDKMIADLRPICSHCSKMEREAEKASYEALEFMVCRYMEQFVGQEFSAIIVNVMRFGFFVKIDNGCEGLVPLGSLDGWYNYDEEKRVLTDSESPSAKSFRLGQHVRVILCPLGEHPNRLTFKVAK